MSEHGRGQRRTRRPRLTKLYRSVVAASDPRIVLQAERAEGLMDEIVTVRLLLRRQLAQDPSSLELTIKGMHLLVRMVVAQHQLSASDAEQFSAGVQKAIDEFAANILGKELGDGREERLVIDGEARALLGEPAGGGSGGGATADTADRLGAR